MVEHKMELGKKVKEGRINKTVKRDGGIWNFKRKEWGTTALLMMIPERVSCYAWNRDMARE